MNIQLYPPLWMKTELCTTTTGRLIPMRSVWRWIGLAGVVGVAAGGVLIARDQRRRNAYTPDDIRTRLHDRVAESETGQAPG